MKTLQSEEHFARPDVKGLHFRYLIGAIIVSLGLATLLGTVLMTIVLSLI